MPLFIHQKTPSFLELNPGGGSPKAAQDDLDKMTKPRQPKTTQTIENQTIDK